MREHLQPRPCSRDAGLSARSIEGCLAAAALVKVIEATPNPAPAGIAAARAQSSSIDVGGGVLDFTGEGRPVSGQVDVAMLGAAGKVVQQPTRKKFDRVSPRLGRRRVQRRSNIFHRSRLMPNRRCFLAFAFVATATAAAAFATPAFAVGALVDLELVDRGRGEPLATWWHRGDAWVAARPGERYAVRLRNRSGERVLVVLSIDGVNAVSGETAATGQTGYVLAPYQTTEITGWRKSLTEAAAFYFTALPDSYAARTDRPDNVGVVGAAIFREKRREPERARETELQSRSALAAASPAPPAAAASPAPPAAAGDAAPPAATGEAARERKAAGAMRDERLGTGHGEREYAPTTQTPFDRAGERPNEWVRIRYDSRDNLIALGVIRPPRAEPVTPDPFPARFVPDPKG